MSEAVEACVDAAGHEFDVSRQRTLLRAASYGQAFCRCVWFADAVAFQMRTFLDVISTWHHQLTTTLLILLYLVTEYMHFSFSYKGIHAQTWIGICVYVCVACSDFGLNWFTRFLLYIWTCECCVSTGLWSRWRLVDTNQVSYRILSQPVYINAFTFLFLGGLGVDSYAYMSKGDEI